MGLQDEGGMKPWLDFFWYEPDPWKRYARLGMLALFALSAVSQLAVAARLLTP